MAGEGREGSDAIVHMGDKGGARRGPPGEGGVSEEKGKAGDAGQERGSGRRGGGGHLPLVARGKGFPRVSHARR